MMANFIAGGLVAIINLATVIYTTRANKKNLNSKALMLLMYDKIQHLCNTAIGEGKIDTEQLRVIAEMHEVYHELGGNGYLDTLTNQVKQLPITN